MISEIDIDDWKATYPEYTPNPEPRKLYEVRRNSVVSLVDDQTQALIQFDHIDGMYSYCWELGKPHNLIHIAAFCDVYVWNKNET
jgi:hypothetical protein